MAIPPLYKGMKLPDGAIINNVQDDTVNAIIVCPGSDQVVLFRRYDPFDLAEVFNDPEILLAKIRRLEQERDVLIDAYADCMGDLIVLRAEYNEAVRRDHTR